MTDMPPPPPAMGPPPGYVAYGDVGAVNRNVQRIGAVAKALWVLLLIYVPLSALNIVATVQLAHKAQQFADGEITKDNFANASRLNIGSIAGYLVVPIAVLTIIWMYRMANNVRALGRPGLRFAPGWAIGGWFTPPCVVYAVPWLMFRELWKASAPEIGPGDPSWRDERVPGIINLWWVCYGLVPLLGIFSAAGIVSQLRNTSDSDARLHDLADQLHKYLPLNLGIAVVGMLSGVVYALMVRQLSARHMRATRER
ncbi:MAG: hypothetical protein JWM12_2598 [Ilumatobacteraceae bacterium]|nr:hypothetical protein [Ilumatobacteraceae bacterium]